MDAHTHAQTTWNQYTHHKVWGGGGGGGYNMVECLIRNWGAVCLVFEPHRRHCFVSLSKTHCPLLNTCTGSTQEDPSWYNWKIVDWDIKNQIKQKINLLNNSQHLFFSLVKHGVRLAFSLKMNAIFCVQL